jgi:TonB-dependent SusC/RagA subfamily outer membrane receptor
MSDRRVILALVGAAALAGCGGPKAETPQPAPEERPTAAVGTVEVGNTDAANGRIEQVLQGRVPGLQVTRTPGGEYQLRIRGSNDEPLVVIDGMTIPPSGVSSALAGLNPRDVLRVEVLKDAAALAMYGSRGGNGVLVITTRR